MITKNVECQLAQGQIGRYLGGDRFSPEAMKQLEGHISECEECMSLLSQKRHDLLERLGSVPTRAVVEVETSKGARERLTEEIAKKGGAVERAKASLLKAMLPKPVIFGSLLAVVLVGMSFMSRGAIKGFGPTASDTLPVSKPDLQTRRSAVPPEPAPPTRNPMQIQRPNPKPRERPAVKVPAFQRQAATVRPAHTTVRRRALPRQVNRYRRVTPLHRRPRSPQTNTIRIYDPQGRPIS